MAPRLSSDEVAAALGRRLGGTVRGLRRLSGGASRVTSAFAVPLGRLQDAEEIAAAICWLLSDAARGVTGEALNVSAGQTMV